MTEHYGYSQPVDPPPTLIIETLTTLGTTRLNLIAQLIYDGHITVHEARLLTGIDDLKVVHHDGTEIERFYKR